MLKAEYYSAPSELEVRIFEKLIPAEPYLRKLKAAIDFEPLRALVAECYAAGMGAPGRVLALRAVALSLAGQNASGDSLRHDNAEQSGDFLSDLPRSAARRVPVSAWAA